VSRRHVNKARTRDRVGLRAWIVLEAGAHDRHFVESWYRESGRSWLEACVERATEIGVRIPRSLRRLAKGQGNG
jgi:hypothetical protein